MSNASARQVFKATQVDGGAGDVRYSLKVSEKQKNNPATVRRYFPQTSFEKPREERAGDMIDSGRGKESERHYRGTARGGTEGKDEAS